MVRITSEEYEALLKAREKRMGSCRPVVAVDKRELGMGRIHYPPRPKYRSKTEARYAKYLDTLRDAGEIEKWEYERIKLKLGEGVWFFPDFLVVRGGRIEIHEVKGAYVRDKGRVKYRAAVDRYPYFGWVWAQFDGKTWNIRRDNQ